MDQAREDEGESQVESESEYVIVLQLAKKLRLSPKTIYNWIRSGDIGGEDGIFDVHGRILIRWPTFRKRQFKHYDGQTAPYDRGYWLFNNRKYAVAIPFFTRAIEEGGDYARFYRSRGDALSDPGHYSQAVEDLRRADRLWPQFPETLESLAYAYSSMGKNQEALNELDLDA